MMQIETQALNATPATMDGGHPRTALLPYQLKIVHISEKDMGMVD